MSHSTLVPVESDKYYREAKLIHDKCCVTDCTIGLTWSWYELIAENLDSGGTFYEIFDAYYSYDRSWW